ncbi:MAG: type II secretion system F family protein [Patescibacteria group bacterium]
MKIYNQLNFTQRLSLLLDAGISFAEALRILRGIEKVAKKQRAYDVLIEDTLAGVSLSKSLAQRKISFDGTLRALIETGESSGSLALCLRQAFQYLEKKNELKKKVIGSLVYPMFIICATIGMTLFLILFIFPKIIPLLTSLNITLPLITRLVLGFYHFSISYGLWTILGGGVALSVLIFLIQRYEGVRFLFHRLLLSLPLFGRLIQIYTLSSLLSTGHILLSSGRSLHDVLLFSQSSSKNILYKKAFGEVAQECLEGVSLAEAFSRYSVKPELFPPLLINMVMIGEKTGNLSQILLHTGKLYGEEVENSLKKFSALIEPLLMVLMGLIVGSIALSIILPVYEITNHLNK